MTAPLIVPGSPGGLPAPPAADEPFTYSAEWLPLAAGATTPQDIAIEADSDFYCTKMTAIGGPSDLAVTGFIPVLVQIKRSGSGADLADRPVPFTSYFGRGDQKDFYPFAWQPYVLFLRNANIRVNLQNLDPANAWQIRIAFHGYKHYG